ncbi:hypothetical protein QC764_507900 [Podospora pseudoanserina]|uniref:Heterokaryon incompatibility domain-containing protein n=1 Tax=Podospora pseudoanserina TaxID=2609844 RepID=A0ABR0I6H8_9PEZI|nr:hypothetical protein QC764_507900 [Podospora pseudoanserina]
MSEKPGQHPPSTYELDDLASCHGVQEGEYEYTALRRQGSIRLLHLLPSEDRRSRLVCQLREYPLLASSQAEKNQELHLYEVLSYTWGDWSNQRSITVDSRRLSVTDNLYEALLALREQHLPRAVWVDAICINQRDDLKKQEQIQPSSPFETARFNTAGIASLDKSELGELIDMYHTRQTTLVHDKVFALLGMSTTDPPHKTFLDYWVGWDVVLKQVKKSLFGALVSVDTWSHSQNSMMSTGGGSYPSSGRFHKPNDSASSAGWTLPLSARSVRMGDIVCIMKGASKSTIVRLCSSLFSIIVSRVSCCGPENIRNFPYRFSLIWDWGCREERQPQRGPSHQSTAVILEAVGDYNDAALVLLDCVRNCKSLGSKAQRLETTNQLVLLYSKANQMEKGFNCLRKELQGRHQYNRDDLQILAPAAASQDGEAMRLLIRHAGGIDLTEAVLLAAVHSNMHGRKVLEILFNQPRYPSSPVSGKAITEAVLIAAAQNIPEGALK